jgi:hypothetical protein
MPDGGHVNPLVAEDENICFTANVEDVDVAVLGQLDQGKLFTRGQYLEATHLLLYPLA